MVLCAALPCCSQASRRSSATTPPSSSAGAPGPNPRFDPRASSPAAQASATPAPAVGVGDASGPECTQDSDCALAPWPIDDAPCCDAPYKMVQSKRAVEARAALRRDSAACHAFDCAAVMTRFQGPPPTPPAKCYFEPRCRNARCGDSC